MATSIVFKLTINVAAALWSADIVNSILDTGSERFSSQAMPQGGIGLLFIALIIFAPPNGCHVLPGHGGQFVRFSAFGGGPAIDQGHKGSRRFLSQLLAHGLAFCH